MKHPGALALALALWLALIRVAFPSPVLTGPLILAVSTDRVAYKPGGVATMSVTLKNGTGVSFSGTITGTMTGRGVQVGAPVIAAVPGLAVNATQTVRLSFQTPSGVDDRGYFVEIVASSRAATVDAAAGVIDESSDWGYYPRTCWQAQTYSAFGTYIPKFPTPEAAAVTLRDWHCNVALGYDQLDKQHRPYNAADVYTNADKLTQSKATILRTIAANKSNGIANLAYIPMNSVVVNQQTPNFQNDGSGAVISDGAFTSKCSPHCTLANMASFPQGAVGGAATTPLGLTDPTSAHWRDYWARVSRPMMTQFHYDGFFIDTVGTFYPTGHPVYTYSGAKIDLTTALSGFYNYQKRVLDSRGFINTVSGWGPGNPGDKDMIQNSTADMLWSERHPEFGDTTTYQSINDAAIRDNSWAMEAGKSHFPLVYALYFDLNLAKNRSCQRNGGPTPCHLNLPGMLYTEAAFGASGIYHAEIADGDRFLDNEGYAVANTLLPTPAIIQSEYDYATFITAQEKLLRDRITDVSTNPAHATTITAGATGSATDAPGKVWVLVKTRPGLQIIQLQNHQQLAASQLNPQDPDANNPAPNRTGALMMKSYYVGSLGGSNKLWFASPDVNHGAPRSIAYVKGSDGRGNFITFSSPPLMYWNMYWLELDSLSASDYAVR